MTIQSIRTAVQGRHVAGDHLLMAAREMALGEVNGVRELDNLAQEIGSRSEAFQDAGHLRPAGGGAPFVIYDSRFAGGFGVFDDADLRPLERGFCGYGIFEFTHETFSFNKVGSVLATVPRRR